MIPSDPISPRIRENRAAPRPEHFRGGLRHPDVSLSAPFTAASTYARSPR